MSVSTKLLKGFESQSEKLEKFVQKYDDKSLSRRLSPEKWSGKEIIGHLGDCEQVYGFRFRLAVAQPGTPFQTFEQVPWVAKLRHQERPVGELVAYFKNLRMTNAALLKTLKDDEWEKFGIHPESGTLSVGDMVKRLTDHFERHLQQVEKAANN